MRLPDGEVSSVTPHSPDCVIPDISSPSHVDPERNGRGVEIAGPLGQGHLRTDPGCVLPVQMSGRALEGPKYQKAHISACIYPTEKYNLSNCIRISQATHFHKHPCSV